MKPILKIIVVRNKPGENPVDLHELTDETLWKLINEHTGVSQQSDDLKESPHQAFVIKPVYSGDLKNV